MISGGKSHVASLRPWERGYSRQRGKTSVALQDQGCCLLDILVPGWAGTKCPGQRQIQAYGWQLHPGCGGQDCVTHAFCLSSPGYSEYEAQGTLALAHHLPSFGVFCPVRFWATVLRVCPHLVLQKQRGSGPVTCSWVLLSPYLGLAFGMSIPHLMRQLPLVPGVGTGSSFLGPIGIWLPGSGWLFWGH